MTNPPKPKTKTDRTTLIIYCIIGVFILIACILFGGAMDCALDQSGHINFPRLGNGFRYVLSHPAFLFSHLTNPKSCVPKTLFVGAAAVGIFALYKCSAEKKRLHRRGTEHGSARWGSEKEMKSLADSKEPEKKATKIDGKYQYDKQGQFRYCIFDNNIILTKEVLLSMNTRQHGLNLHTCVLGTSGAGKTRKYILTNILQGNTSIVVNDPKAESYELTANALEAMGYDVRVLNLIDMQHSCNYNPFHYAASADPEVQEKNIEKLTKLLFSATKGAGEKEDFWAQKAQSAIKAVIGLLFAESEYTAEFDEKGWVIDGTRDESNLHFAAVAEKLRKMQYPPRGIQKPDGFFLQREPNESEQDFQARREHAFLSPLDRDFIELEKRFPDKYKYAKNLYAEVRNAAEETGQSIISSANVKTASFNMQGIQNLTCTDNIHLEEMGEKKVALFLIIPATDKTFNYLVNMMYIQMFDTLVDRAIKFHNSVLPVPVRCLMDEFANLPQIEGFPEILAFVRSFGISINIILQNLAQIKGLYEKQWESIIGNCSSLLLLGATEESTLKYMSELLGKETIDVKGQNRTRGRQSSTSENNSILGRELLTPDEISSIPYDQCILKCASRPPFYCTKYDVAEHPNYWLVNAANENGSADYQLLHTVTLTEFTAQQKELHGKAATSINSSIAAEEAAESKPEPKKVTTFFRQSKEIQISAETVLPSSYEEAAELLEEAAQEAETSDEVQYNQSKPEFGIPEEWESVDFGEPIREREEVEEDDEIEISPAEEQSDVLHYAVPAAEPTVLPELVQEEVAAVISVIREQQPRYAPENALPKEEDYFDPENNDMDSFMS